MKKNEFIAKLADELKKRNVADAADVIEEYEQHFAFKLSDSKELRSLLILFPPKLKSVPSLGFMTKGGIQLCRFFGSSLFRRSMIYENNCRRIKSRLSTPDTWYCMCLVVAPEAQGHGIGSGLIKPVLNILDKYRAPAYLETHKERNTRIYKHLGLDLADISAIPGTGIKQYAMLRNG